ncbi:hypothetical protein B6U96_16620 [Archaeoglobales archaeon ex4484_92]|nr:MAG: hypothetical protein B6U96_16620 [Archaeoglobales archaeon ex4484_92]
MNSLIFPIVFFISSYLVSIPFMKFMDYPEARTCSIIALAFFTFLLSVFIPFKISFYIVFTVLLILSILFMKYTKFKSDEIVFLSVFFFFIFLRWLDPTILDAEKLMDMAFVNAIIKSKSLHPEDPFFAGEKLDFYYYFGHFISSCITCMSFTTPEIGYNISISSIPAYSSLLIYGILKRRGKLALLGVLITLFSGNLYSVLDLIRRLYFKIPIDGSFFWDASRVVKGTINEFPYFSFIHADLHAHVVAIPLKILLVLLLYKITMSKKNSFIYYFFLTVTLFSIFATNSWDFPLMFLLCLLVVLLNKDRRMAISILSSLLFITIFYLSLKTVPIKITYVNMKTELFEFLMYAAFPIIFAYAFLFDKKAIYVSIPVATISYFFRPIFLILTPLFVSSIFGISKRSFSAVLSFIGCLAFMIPEFLSIESRLNTVFKFYLIGWIMLLLSSSLEISLNEQRKRLIVLILVILMIVYPIFATPVRYSKREFTLDGLIYTKEFCGDYYAIKWLQSKYGVIIEEGCTRGALCAYKYGGRVAAFTGNPTVIAWTNHEFIWRGNYSKISERAKDVKKFYKTSSCKIMREIAKKYKVKYIFVGYEEKRVFGVSLKKFENCFEKVYQYDGTAIFRAN